MFLKSFRSPSILVLTAHTFFSLGLLSLTILRILFLLFFFFACALRNVDTLIRRLAKEGRESDEEKYTQ